MCPAPSLGGHAKAVTQLPEEGRVVLPVGQVPPGTTQIQNHGGGSAPTRPAKPRMTFLLLGPLWAGEQTGQAVLGSCPGSGPTTHACPRKQASGCRTTRGHPFKAPPQMLLAGAPQCSVMVGGAEHQAHAALVGRAQDLQPRLRPRHVGNTQEAGHLLQPSAGKAAPPGPCNTQQAPRLLCPSPGHKPRAEPAQSKRPAATQGARDQPGRGSTQPCHPP